MMNASSWRGPGFALVACALLGTAGCNSKSNGSGGTTGSTTSSTSTGTASTSSSTGSTGTGGSVPSGPITGIPDNTWTFVDFPDSMSMAGTPTGIGVNFNSASKDLIIYLEGGNACFNTVSCAITYNPGGYQDTMPPKNGSQSNFEADKPMLEATPMFTRAAGNPLKDYNYVFVPYTTGDLHFGDATGTVGGKMRNFHGYKNMQAFLKRLTATFPSPTNVILAGSSAGGFGAALNYDQVSQAFGASVKVKLIDDSGPPMAEMFIPACLQKAFADTWGFANTLPKGCTACATSVAANGVFTEPFVDYITTTYPDRTLTLISSTQDGTISEFLGYGDNDCSMLAGAPGAYPGTEYAAGLADLRDRMVKADPNFFTYYIDGSCTSPNVCDDTHHVWLAPSSAVPNAPNGVSSNGVLLSDWLNQVVTGDPALTDVPAQMPAGG